MEINKVVVRVEATLKEKKKDEIQMITKLNVIGVSVGLQVMLKNAMYFFNCLFADLTLIMTKLKVLILHFIHFTDISIIKKYSILRLNLCL